MTRRLDFAGRFLAVFVAVAALAGASVVQAQPTTLLWSPACNTGAGGIVGRTYSDGLCALPGSGSTGAGSANIGSVNIRDSGLGDATDPTNHAVYVESGIGVGCFSAGGCIGANRFTSLATISSFNATTLVGASTSNYSYITDLDCSNGTSNPYTLTIANATPVNLYTLTVPANSNWVKTFDTPIGGSGQMLLSTALNITAAYNGAPTYQAVNATGSSYTGGVVTLNLSPASIPVYVGEIITVSGATGTGADLALVNTTAAVTAVSGTTVSYAIATGKTITAITGGTVTYAAPLTQSVSTGTYANGTTNVVALTLGAAIPLYVGQTIFVTNLAGTGAFASLNQPNGAVVTAVSGTTVSYVVSGPGASTITGGTVTYQPAPTNLVCNTQGRLRNQ